MAVLKHIILGAGGAIGNPLARELVAHGETVKLVSRGARTIPGAESAQADLTRDDDVRGAVEPGATVYLLAGLPYRTDVWQRQWPVVMGNAVQVCREKDAALIFFDNVYPYGRVSGPMTEDTPLRPSSRKGEIRAQVDEILLGEMRAGRLRAIIARSADFYGPFSERTSVPTVLVLERLARGKRAQWLVSARRRHSFTYTLDCGRALYRLARTEGAFGQVWHMPTAGPAITGEEFIRAAARAMGVEPRWSVLSKPALRLAGLFDRTVRESYEMLYQNEMDYVFDSSKFERAFDFKPTPYEAGIRESVRTMRTRVSD